MPGVCLAYCQTTNKPCCHRCFIGAHSRGAIINIEPLKLTPDVQGMPLPQFIFDIVLAQNRRDTAHAVEISRRVEMLELHQVNLVTPNNPSNQKIKAPGNILRRASGWVQEQPSYKAQGVECCLPFVCFNGDTIFL